MTVGPFRIVQKGATLEVDGKDDGSVQVELRAGILHVVKVIDFATADRLYDWLGRHLADTRR